MSAPVLLYDGNCGFCDRTVKFALARDPGGPLRFAPLQSPFGAGVIARHPEIAGVDSLIWVEGEGPTERVSVRSAGAMQLGSYVGGVWGLLAALAVIVPRALRDAAYDAFAKRRYRWFGTSESCELPTPEERARFLTHS